MRGAPSSSWASSWAPPLFLVAAACSAAACSRSTPSATSSAPVQVAVAPGDDLPEGGAGLAHYLPDEAGGFSGELLEVANDYARRSYTRGRVRVEVTLADATQLRMPFDRWVAMSGDYPQVNLDLPASAAAGFYECAGEGAAERCNAHLHFRTGFHVEVMGAGSATRDDLQDLVQGLPLRTLAGAGK